jgi:hypothetical protein
MKKGDIDLFDKWQKCSHEAGNYFFEYIYRHHVFTKYSSAYEEGEIPQLMARIGRDFYTPDHPKIDKLLDVFYNNFFKIQKKVKEGEITYEQFIAKFESRLLWRKRGLFYVDSKKKEEQEKGKRPKEVSLDSETNQRETGDGVTRHEIVPDPNAITPEELAIEAEDSKEASRLLEEFEKSLSRQLNKLLSGTRRLREQEGYVTITMDEAALQLGLNKKENISAQKNRINEKLTIFLRNKNIAEDEEVARKLIHIVSTILDFDRT